MNDLCAIAAGLAIICAVAVVMWNHYRMKKTFDSIGQMIDLAMDDSFLEKKFDESRMSALETKFAQYLSASAVSARNVKNEKDKIKTLIADISHQTKTPLSNILLYGQLLEERMQNSEEKELVRQIISQTSKLEFLIQALVKMLTVYYF